jgi:hypothetical protein
MKFARKDYDSRIKDIESKIPEDEPCFLLRGQDQFAPALLLEWAKLLRLNGGNPSMARSAEDHAQSMIRWQKSHGTKIPDAVNDLTEDKIHLINDINDIIDDITLNKFTNESWRELNSLVMNLYETDEQLVSICMSCDLINNVYHTDKIEVSDFVKSVRNSINKSKIAIYFDKINNKVYLLKNEIPPRKDLE